MKMSKFSGTNPEYRNFRPSKKLVDSNTLLGLEIELENVHSDGVERRLEPYWDVSLDEGSLRPRNSAHSCEFKLSKPLAGYDIVKAILALERAVRDMDYTPVRSSRTSTHVHIDVRNMNHKEVIAFIVLYLGVEKLLYHYAGKHREQNNFCVPCYATDFSLGPIANFLYLNKENETQVFKEVVDVYSRNNRYLGLNIHALQKFGTLEFRMLGGEYRFSKLLRWLNILLSIKKASEEVPFELVELPMRASIQGIDNFVEHIFGKYSKYLAYEGYELDVYDGLRSAQDILYKEKFNDTLWNIIKIPAKGEDVREKIKQWESKINR